MHLLHPTHPIPMNLSSSVSLITGGTRIGSDVALALAGAGSDVALVYRRSREAAESTAARIREHGRRAMLVQADVADTEQCRAAVTSVVAELGRLDVLVNMASRYEAIAFDELSSEEWDRQLAVDLRAAFVFSHAAVPEMRKAGQGRIVNFSDWVAAAGRPRYSGYLAYYVAKAGVKALTEAMALELAADQILVNAIAPGPILAPDEMTEAARERVTAATPLGRWGGAAEVAKAVLFLVNSDFVTGETIRVDGGRHVK
jgi:NAD(P)-dependent dehydrogenase (short-subunit alcohol dehydrogenase family)